jgi:G:T-mismatch repair DNA endonuclease (very short patch repair protein)
MGRDTLSERFEKTMARLEQIARAVYEVETIWECEFDECILAHHPVLQVHPMVEHSHLNTRDAMFGG